MATKTATKKAEASAPKFDIYEHINNVVIEGLEKQGLKWFRSWKDNEGPINRATKTHYNGINIFWLNWVCATKGYKHNQWLTYKQATEMKGQVRNGEKSTDVFFYQISFFHKPTNKWFQTEQQLVAAGLSKSSPNVSVHFNLRYYNVFNVEQIDGVDPLQITPTEFTPCEAAEKLVNNYCQQDNLVIHHKDSRAYYSPSLDYINMPVQNSFIDSDSYYKVLFHELAHSTGHSNRLNRDGVTNMDGFGTDQYAKEELVAEIASMYLSGDLGLSPMDDYSNSQAYIKGWVSKLKDHKYECVSAMTAAAKAVEYIKKFNK